MVNNYEKIRQFMSFRSADDFYYLQVMKRNKDCGANAVVKAYFIKSKEELDMQVPEIIALCEHHNARAYINLNRRSFEKVGFHTLKKITDQIMNRDFRSIRKAYTSVCGSHGNEPEKLRVVDIDEGEVDDVIKVIDQLQPYSPVLTKEVMRLKTPNGWHLITTAFDLQSFRDMVKNIDVHKDNPTILYAP